MQHRGNSSTDRLVSFFELSNTIPEIKRKVFIGIQLFGILLLVGSSLVMTQVSFDWFLLLANMVLFLFLTAMTWLLWRRRERQELLLFIIFFGSAAWLLMVMVYNILQVPAGAPAALLNIVSPYFVWIILIHMVCFLTFRAASALRMSLIISVMTMLILLYCITRVAPIQPLAWYDYALLFFANILVLVMAYPLARAQEKTSQTDFLTSLPNRSRGYSLLVNEIERAQRYNEIFAIILYDIDHFKKINDTCGHPCGDDVLRQVSAFADEHIRRTDTLCRWGGEEFLIVMPHTDLASARLKADHLRLQFTNRPFHQSIRLTASFGVTAYYPYDSANSILERVDGALYHAKRNGRNCVQVE